MSYETRLKVSAVYDRVLLAIEKGEPWLIVAGLVGLMSLCGAIETAWPTP